MSSSLLQHLSHPLTEEADAIVFDKAVAEEALEAAGHNGSASSKEERLLREIGLALKKVILGLSSQCVACRLNCLKRIFFAGEECSRSI